jgi:hypothetical protein
MPQPGIGFDCLEHPHSEALKLSFGALGGIDAHIGGLNGIIYSLWVIYRSFAEILHYEELNFGDNLFDSGFNGRADFDGLGIGNNHYALARPDFQTILDGLFYAFFNSSHFAAPAYSRGGSRTAPTGVTVNPGTILQDCQLSGKGAINLKFIINSKKILWRQNKTAIRIDLTA